MPTLTLLAPGPGATRLVFRWGWGSATAPEPSGAWLVLVGSVWLQHVDVLRPAALCHAPPSNASSHTQA